MAKVRIDTKRLTRKIEETFRELLTKDAVYVEIAKFSTERIQSFARLQKRMVQDGEDKANTPNLSAKYIKRRQDSDPGRDNTDPTFFLPNVKKSQLTFTGQLLRGLRAKVLRKGIDKGTVELSFGGERDDGKRNADIYRWLNERDSGYEVLALSEKAIERIRTIVLTSLRKALIKSKLK